MRITSDGNVGIGTSSITTLGTSITTLEIKGKATFRSGGLKLSSSDDSIIFRLFGADATVRIGSQTATPFLFYTNDTERMRITDAGNVGIGTSSPKTNLDIASLAPELTLTSTRATNAQGDVLGAINFYNSDLSGDSPNNAAIIEAIASTGTGASADLLFRTKSVGADGADAVESMRIDSDGTLFIGKTSTALGTVGIYITASGVPVSSVTTGVNSYQLYSASSSSFRFYVNENGGVYNHSGNNVNLSDERTKTNIELSGSYLDKICAIPVKLFNYKDEADGAQRTLGVIAQEVEAVAPELVSNDGWEGDEAEDGTPLKGIYTQDMMFALMKYIQEQQVIINDLKARIETLESK
jgi:hypothetical protein